MRGMLCAMYGRVACEDCGVLDVHCGWCVYDVIHGVLCAIIVLCGV